MAGNKNSGRRRLSVAEKKLKGTFRKDRQSEQEQIENEITQIVALNKDAQIKPPKNLVNKNLIEFYKSHTKKLLELGLLAPFDLPELNAMYEVLQQYYDVVEELKKTNIKENFIQYKELTDISQRLLKTFSSLSSKYYISPTARAKLTLDVLDIQHKQNENKSAITRAMNNES